MAYETIKYDIADQILTITLNRPDKLNAFNMTMMNELIAAFDKADADDNEGKHLDIFNRRATRGQCFHQPCLGTREFAAKFELIPADAPLPAAIDETRDLGFMLWDIDHAAKGRPSLLFRAHLDRGIVNVPAPGSPEIKR